MTDYNLSGLSTRSFEQLIQALAAHVIGPGLVVFGDGPDGGREATFEGPSSYPTQDHAWNGYTVVQAKFKQRLEDTKKDGDWALAQLTKELHDFTDQKKKRRKPEYYIFATNVVLTPVLDKGAKDRMAEVFEGFKKSLPIKGYALWDYDQIRVFLDNAESVRRSYAAWITPGDVLSQVIDWLAPQTKNFDQIITNFLQKELQTDQFVNLEQAGHAVEDRIPIARVFIDAPAFSQSTFEPPNEQIDKLLLGFVSDVLSIASERLDPQSQVKPLADDRPDRFAQPQPGRVVLIGGPGQGKTTFAQFVCQLFRAAILNEKSAVLAVETLQALAVIETQSRLESIPLPTARRFPVRVVLSEFAAALARKETTSLLSYLVERIRKRTDQTISAADFRKWLTAYPWLLVLDGLDEVPASSNREEVIESIRNFWVDATECNADILVIATTRPQGYGKEFSPELYQHYWLAPLSTARALHYAHRLVDARYGTDADRREKILTRLRSASASDATARLMRSPLQVTIMAALVDKVGKPPQERWTLFRDYYKVIYDREVERDIPAAEILRDYKPDIDTIHYRVGLLLQIQGESSGQTDARLSRSLLTEIITDRLLEEEHSEAEVALLQEKITKAAAERLVFIAGVEADRIGFEIRSFQEFMAAECLMEGDDKSIRERLREIGPIAYWRNVFLFAAGKCFAERQHLRDVILALCDEMNDDPDDPALRVTMGGSQLALDLLEDGPARRQPKYAQALARNALRLLDLQPSEFHKRLADLYETAFAHAYQQDIESKIALNNRDRRLGAWECLSYLTEMKVGWANELVDRNWPNKHNEMVEVLEIAIKRGITSPFFSRLADSLHLFCPSELEHLHYLFDRNKRVTPDGGVTIDLSTISPSLPLWISSLEGIYERKSQNSVMMRMPTTSDSAIKVSYTPLDKTRCDWLALKDVTEFHHGWAPTIAGARFLANPSKGNLAQELRFLAECELFTLQPIPFAAAWPFAACCAVAKDKRDLAQIADRVERGEFGDIEDWKKAELRWQENGLIEADFCCAQAEGWPFSSQVADCGFPFRVAAFSYLDTETIKAFSDDLSKLRLKLQDRPIRAVLAQLLFHLIIGHLPIAEWDFPSTLELFEESKQRSKWVSMDFEALTYEMLVSPMGLKLFDQIGRSARLYYLRPDSERVTSMLAKGFVTYPSAVGLLRIFSFMTNNMEDSIPRHLLDPNTYSDPLIKEAALLVRLGQKKIDQDEQHKLAELTASIARSQKGGDDEARLPGVIRRALYVARRYQTGDSCIEPFLLTLEAIESNDDSHGDIVDTLIQILRLRLSLLRQPTVWSRLRLPNGLGRILQNSSN